MWRRIIYRLALIVPITFSILFITLFLFYTLPGVHVLDSRELQVGSERELILTLRLQEQQNPFAYNRGLFYIGIYAGYLPLRRDHIPLMFHASFHSLCKDIRNPHVMNDYAEWVREQLGDFTSSSGSGLSAHQFVQILKAQNRMEFLAVMQTLDPEVVPPVWKRVVKAPVADDISLLNISWNGKHNIFHSYLNAIFFGDPALHTSSGELVQTKFGRTVWWTLAYTLPALLGGWLIVYVFMLLNYDRPGRLQRINRLTLVVYSVPTFVLATLALVFLTSHRYGVISSLFPFPVFVENRVQGLFDIYRYYGAHLILPMLLFALSPMLLLFRIFHEKMEEVRRVRPSFRYLRHLGLPDRTFRLRYLSRYLLVAGLAVLSNIIIALLGGSLVIEWIFNIPGLGRYLYQSIINYDVPSTVFLVVVFTIVQQVGHILTDLLIDLFSPSSSKTEGLL